MGRTITTTYDGEEKEKILTHVLAEVAGGRPISRILREDDDMPSPAAFWGWQLADPDLMEKVTQARAHGSEALFDEAIDIADDLEDSPKSRSIRVTTRIKAAQMLKPKTYGPKLDLTSGGEKIGLSAEIEASRRRAAEGE